jgi:hypothetical protein
LRAKADRGPFDETAGDADDATFVRDEILLLISFSSGTFGSDAGGVFVADLAQLFLMISKTRTSFAQDVAQVLDGFDQRFVFIDDLRAPSR